MRTMHYLPFVGSGGRWIIMMNIRQIGKNVLGVYRVPQAPLCVWKDGTSAVALVLTWWTQQSCEGDDIFMYPKSHPEAQLL